MHTDQCDTFYADLPCPVIVREVESGRITYANAAAAELAGLPEPGEMVGRTTFDLWPDRAAEWRQADRESIAAGTATRIEMAQVGRCLRVTRAPRADCVLVSLLDCSAEVNARAFQAIVSAARYPLPSGRLRCSGQTSAVAAELLESGSNFADICCALGLPADRVLESLRHLSRPSGA